MRKNRSEIRTLHCGNLTIELGARTMVMGILNVTPDSFSDGGRHNGMEAAVQHARRMVTEGADIIDVGGESTRPGFDKVSLDEELRRVVPIVSALREAVDVPISVDTYKAEVARQVLEAGAHIINDIWGFKEDPAMAVVAAHYGCPVVLMHNRRDMNYRDFMQDLLADLQESIGLARAAGVKDDRIILDPGIGFVKDYAQNLEAMDRLGEVAALGYPVLLGTSRKSFIQRTLDLPASEVAEGTAATVALGIAQGCDIVRVHDVLPMKRVAAMTDAIVRRR